MKTVQVEKMVIKFKHITSLKSKERTWFINLALSRNLIPEGAAPAARQGSQRPGNHVAQPPAVPLASSSTEASLAPTSTSSQFAPPLLLKAANH